MVVSIFFFIPSFPPNACPKPKPSNKSPKSSARREMLLQRPPRRQQGTGRGANVRGEGLDVGFRTLGRKGPIPGRLWALGVGVLGSRLTFGGGPVCRAAGGSNLRLAPTKSLGLHQIANLPDMMTSSWFDAKEGLGVEQGLGFSVVRTHYLQPGCPTSLWSARDP